MDSERKQTICAILLLMPLKTPASASRSSGKAKGKAATPSHAKGKTAQSKAKPAARLQPEPVPPSWWSTLSPERKLDVVGAVMAVVGILTVLILFSAQRSALTGSLLGVFRWMLGWGMYILPVALIVMGTWLILRRIEKLPRLSLERATGIVLFFLWLVTLMHSIVPLEMAEQAVLDGIGGGYIGSLFARILLNGFGTGGTVIALLAWLLITLTMILDLTVADLFRWVPPLLSKARAWLQTPINKTTKTQALEEQGISSNGYTPLDRPQPVVKHETPGVPVRTVRTSEPVIQWQLPDVKQILDSGIAPALNDEFIEQRSHLIEETLSSFGAPVQVVVTNRGPTITQFGVEPLFVETRSGRTKVRVNKIASLADDLALALAAPRIRIQAPVPGHSYVGIEVPNDEMALVALRDLVESDSFQRNKQPLKFALGKDVTGNPIQANLEAMPHLLIAGTTGSGKSVCVNAILTCFLLHNTPDDLRLILVDPKRVELTGYNGIPHLLSPVVVEIDRVIGALQWMTEEMDRRYHKFAQVGSRNIADYNAKMKSKGEKKLPFLVIVIDELADLMMIAPGETEQKITRLAQLARATGIHMILATQRPSVDVVTGLIKANFPARIAFAVASNTDSRVILDQPGAERLLGRGDMLFQAPDAPSAARLQGVFVSDGEIQDLVEFWRAQNSELGISATPATAPVDMPPSTIPLKQTDMFGESASSDSNADPLLTEAIDLVRREGRASVSMLQRRMRIGYTRAARIVDMMEDKGIVGPPEGTSQLRPILDYGPTVPPKDDGI
ncbi:MAG TPA: DNA translocase FtsK 4TM domain-containing protein [Anaerolineales bacterium]|jgi:S-DNA-T family DNA segregation ATPase FtsK/SpoIIIE|nr:DNA translocase FtsK 4TM domain-containing protein [Anaerolineales bacterium]